MFEDSAIEIFIDGFGDNFTQEAELFFIFMRIGIYEIPEMEEDDLLEG